MAEWRVIPGFDGFYEASDDGRVRSVNRVIRSREGRSRLYVGRILRPDYTTGYARVTLQKRGVILRLGVHVLVARCFLGEKPEGAWVLHRDDNKKNNAPANLYYGTIMDNARDAIENGRQVRGEAVVQSKLRESDIPEIRKLRREGLTHATIGRRYGVTAQAVCVVCKGRSWRWMIPPDQLPRGGAPVPPRRA